MIRSILVSAILFAAPISSSAQTTTPGATPTPATPPTANAQGARPPRPPAPTRDPHTQGYVEAKDLPDGENAPVKADGNFIIGPTHNPAPEMTVQDGVPQGTINTFTLESTDSKFYSGIAREPGSFGRPDPNDPNKLLINSHPAPYSRKVTVYVPKQYIAGTAAPLLSVRTDRIKRCSPHWTT